MTTATTTLELIRDNMIAKLEALTPTLLSGIKFERHRAEEPFMPWTEMNAAAAFRRYSLLQDGATEPPVVSDMDVEQRRSGFNLLIAYPKQWGRYGKEAERDADDFIEADLRLIEGRSGIGHNAYAGYVSGQMSALIVSSIERGERVLFSRLAVTVDYYRSVSL